MHEYLVAAVLGVVQGATEFLPISSTGHLIIVGNLLDIQDDARTAVFEVIIQLGSILAVVFLYWRRFLGLLIPQKEKKFSGIHGIFLLLLTTLPAGLVGLFAHDVIVQYLFTPVSVALALAVGALCIFLVEKFAPKPNITSLDEISWKTALGVGCFQCLALWPGFSRSASTILGGLLLGEKREVAASYSFIAAVPIMFAATLYSLYKNISNLHQEDIAFFLIGTVVAFFAALLAISVLVRLVSQISFRPFAWYRLCLAPLILYYWL